MQGDDLAQQMVQALRLPVRRGNLRLQP